MLPVRRLRLPPAGFPQVLSRPSMLAAPCWRRVSSEPGKQKPAKPPPPTRREDIYTLPNALTLSRLAAAPFIGHAVLHDRPGLAVGLLAYAAATDVVDGFLARRLGRRTVVGSVLDPLADKVLMTVLTVSLAVRGALPLWLAAIILLRDAALAVAALYYRYISLPPPRSLARYVDFSLPSAEVRPTAISKYNTALQLLLVGATTAAPLVPGPWAHDILSPALGLLHYVVAVTTVASGVSYVVSKDAVRILSHRRPGQKP